MKSNANTLAPKLNQAFASAHGIEDAAKRGDWASAKEASADLFSVSVSLGHGDQVKSVCKAALDGDASALKTASSKLRKKLRPTLPPALEKDFAKDITTAASLLAANSHFHTLQAKYAEGGPVEAMPVLTSLMRTATLSNIHKSMAFDDVVSQLKDEAYVQQAAPAIVSPDAPGADTSHQRLSRLRFIERTKRFDAAKRAFALANVDKIYVFARLRHMNTMRALDVMWGNALKIAAAAENAGG